MHAVGIDLGTTHTVVAWAPIEADSEARVFAVPQLVGAASVEARPLFPSVLYAPPPGERIEDPFGDAPWVLGELARRRGAEVAGRLVASSKSWLTHTGVDRRAAILPWGGQGDDPTRLSPVDAATRLLAHVKRAWQVEHPSVPLAEQEVVLTVPASFDEVARELTLEAAQRAGIAPKLLEEPQAAFYDWMAHARADGIASLVASAAGDALVLVVDVGGGTTDLSLVRVSSVDTIKREAVGPHVLLGGDNMDLALAYAVEPRLADDSKLDPARFSQLVGACRAVKERLLGVDPPEDAPVSVAGSGSALLGSARTTRILRAEAERIVVDGFFPLVPGDARPQRGRGALVAFGLPYEREVAITRHLASFLARHVPVGSAPTAVLLNGGVFRAAAIADRLVQALESWYPGRHIERLADADPDLTVARGAVTYARARRGRGRRIGGGAARGFYVAVGGDADRRTAVCIVPRGAEEGVPQVAYGRAFALAVGRPVRFDVLASDVGDARAGDVVDVDDDRFAPLPPLVATLDGASGREVRVAIEAELTPVGTLDLACVETEGAPPRRHRLAFQLRTGVTSPPPPSLRPSQGPSGKRMQEAFELVERAFGKARADATGREAKDLLRELERVLGERTQWTMDVSRALFDGLVPFAKARRRSLDHERVFWLLAGWCVRPGFGHPLDPTRVAALTALLDGRLAFPAEARGWQQFFIAWRRAAAGMDQATQTAVRELVDPWLGPTEPGRKKPKKPALALDDALDMASTLERVPPTRRSQLGGWILERTWTDRDPRLWLAIGRIGARVPTYASAHHVVTPLVAERWLDHLLREKWDAVPTAGQAAARMARWTGDRARDVGERVRAEVERRLVAAGADERTLRPLREVVPVEESERAALFGDALPPGLRLVE